MNRRPEAGPTVWAALFAIGLAWEAREIQRGCDGWPLSRCIRQTFRTNTPTGSHVFTAAVKAGSGVLIWHILQPQPPREGNNYS